MSSFISSCIGCSIGFFTAILMHYSDDAGIHVKMDNLKAACEKELPRNKHCVMVMKYIPDL